MLILHFLPGGKTAGQVPLEFAIEHYFKDQKLGTLENEYELEALARDRKKGDDNDVELAIMKSKKEENEIDYDANEVDLLRETIDEGAFFIQPRFSGDFHDSMSSIHAITSMSAEDVEAVNSVSITREMDEKASHNIAI